MGTQPGTEAHASAAATGSTANTGSGSEGISPDPASGSSPREIAEGIKFSCLLNARYHASREAFLEGVHRWFMFVVILLGTGSFVNFAGRWMDSASEWFGAAAAVIAALDLAFDLSNRARTHSLMKRRYFELLADFDEGKVTPVQVRACINRFSADEEPAYQTLLQLSWNSAQEMVYGDTALRLDIGWWDRFTRHVFRRGAKQYSLIKI